MTDCFNENKYWGPIALTKTNIGDRLLEILLFTKKGFLRAVADSHTLVFAPPALIPCSFPLGIYPRRGEEYLLLVPSITGVRLVELT